VMSIMEHHCICLLFLFWNKVPAPQPSLWLRPRAQGIS
jgi:hypothetical protein